MSNPSPFKFPPHFPPADEDPLFFAARGDAYSPQQLLRDAADVIAQRGAERDTSTTGQQQERSMAATVRAFNAIEGTHLSERQGWVFMQCLKLSRAASTARNGRFNLDDYLDGAAYAALTSEAAHIEAKS